MWYLHTPAPRHAGSHLVPGQSTAGQVGPSHSQVKTAEQTSPFLLHLPMKSHRHPGSTESPIEHFKATNPQNRLAWDRPVTTKNIVSQAAASARPCRRKEEACLA
jgi:hypothetical protein